MRVLIVEDEYLIAMDTAACLEDAGCAIVGIAASVDNALALLAAEECDAAVLDANLKGVSAEPVAEALCQRGIPYLVVSGYAPNQRPGLLATAPALSKPCLESKLVAAVLALRG